MISKEELLEALYLEFINRVNEVGVDVNRCVNNSHTALLVQFVCGLGPRKGFHLLRVGMSKILLFKWMLTCKFGYLQQILNGTNLILNRLQRFFQILKQNNSRLENRTQLVTMCHMGPKVFINCAGFIKIDTNALGERLVQFSVVNQPS